MRLVLHFYNFMSIFILEFGFVLLDACFSFFQKRTSKLLQMGAPVIANGSSTRTMFIEILCWRT